MRIGSRVGARIAVLGVSVVAVLGLSGAVAAAGGHVVGGKSFSSGVVGSMPDEPLFGVASGGLPWMDGGSRVRLSHSGRLVARVHRLVLSAGPNTGRNPVPMIFASVVCNGSVVDSTDPVAYSTAGNARIRASVDLPDRCLAPAVLLRIPNAAAGNPYIGVTGVLAEH